MNLKTFLKENSTAMRLARTIAQGVLSVLVVNIDLLVSFITIPPELKPVLVALCMAIFSPIMSELGKAEQ